MYSELLGLVEKPVRYIGQEWNQIVKPPAPGLSRVAFAFPDSYEIGMSHLGMRILYDLLNRQPDIAAERVFCPAVDMEAALRRFALPLATLETRTPLSQLDVIGFSLQFEMEYTNVLTMLDLGGVPLHSAERAVLAPLVIAGGPCALSPEPLSDFIDAFVIGDGEEAFPAVVRRWAELRREGGRSREAMLTELAQLGGVYVPSLYCTEHDAETGFDIVTGPRPGFDVPFPIVRTVIDDLSRFPYPDDTIVPYGEIVHDRVSIEIARGCTEGCRFCQAGIIYRPVRERSPADIIRAALGGLKKTGYDEVSLTSLSTADYSCVSTLVKAMMDRLEPEKTAMSVSSMRVYGLTKSIAEQLARVRRTGFTIAPEAGTQRMRDLINKGITDADIDTAARIAFGQGWSQLKMYFMIGLPTETEADVLGIADTGLHVLRVARELGRHGARVTVSASALVPKPHSTFQWEPMDGAAALKHKQRLLVDALRRHRNVTFKYSKVEEGIVECLLSRGDRRLGQVIETAWRRGSRFDSWSDHFDYGRWMQCMQDAGLDPELFLRRIPIHAKLPWDHIDSRVLKKFLVEDMHRGMKNKFSPACEKPFIPRDPSKPVKPLEHAKLVCYDCGLECDLEAIKQERIAQRDSLLQPGPELEAAFRGEKPATEAQPRLRPTIPIAAARLGGGDGLGTNAFEATSGIRHGEAVREDVERDGGDGSRDDVHPRRDLAPLVHVGKPDAARASVTRLHFRVEYVKRGELRWLSHLDLLRALQRAFKRAGIVLQYSQGFHPAPRLSFGPALPTGMEGEAELFDFETPESLDPESAEARLRDSLPAGLAVRSVRFLAPGSPTLAQCVDLGEYRAWINEERRVLLPEEFAGLDAARFHDPGAQRQWAAALLARPQLVVVRRAKEATRELDIRPFVRDVGYLPECREVQLWLRLGSQGQARPQEVLGALYGVPGTCFRIRRQRLGLESELLPALEDIAMGR